MGEFADFRVEHLRPAADIAVVAAGGELDLYTSDAFRESLLGAIEDGARRVVVDFTDVTFIDSSALGVLVGGARRAAERGIEMVIVCPAGSVARVIEITGLNRAFAIYATRDEAFRAGADAEAR